MRHFFWLFPLFKFAALHATFLKKRAVRIWIGRENSEKISEDLSKCIFFYFVIAECVTVSIILSNVDKDYVITSNLMRHQPWKKGKGYFF